MLTICADMLIYKHVFVLTFVADIASASAGDEMLNQLTKAVCLPWQPCYEVTHIKQAFRRHMMQFFI